MLQNRNYNVFFTLYENGNMAKSAEILGYESHASVSKSIKALEQDLGVTLFESHARGVKPTEQAEKFYQALKPLFNKIHSIEQQLLGKTKKQNKDDDFSVALFLMGGTIDLTWNPLEGLPEPTTKSVLSEYITKIINPSYRVYSYLVTNKDSRDITDALRQELIKDIKKSAHKHILITHGTFTMADTAKYLHEKVNSDPELQDRRIVFTGSYYPIDNFAKSDAQANIGFALATLQTMDCGVTVVMNGRSFDPTKVIKDLKSGRFVETE